MMRCAGRCRRSFLLSQILLVELVVLGVNAVNGVPQEPIEGFEPAAREEIPLTIENICLQNLYPPVFPRISEVRGAVAGSKFFVLEVDEDRERRGSATPLKTAQRYMCVLGMRRILMS